MRQIRLLYLCSQEVKQNKVLKEREKKICIQIKIADYVNGETVVIFIEPFNLPNPIYSFCRRRLSDITRLYSHAVQKLPYLSHLTGVNRWECFLGLVPTNLFQFSEEKFLSTYDSQLDERERERESPAGMFTFICLDSHEIIIWISERHKNQLAE